MMLPRCLGFLLFSFVVVESRKSKRVFPHYQGAAIDVLRDINNGTVYDAIYMTYHHCVWSEYGNGADGNGCNGDGDDYSWYMGRTQCYRANAAYSLYGVRQGEATPRNPCAPSQYINSFFTTQGVDYLATALNLANDDGATSECAVEDADDDQNDYYEHNAVKNNNDVSYTTACSMTGGTFVQASFKGAYCNQNRRIKVLDNLDDFNTELNYFQCVQIYDSYGTYVMNDNGDGNWDDDGKQQAADDDNQNAEEENNNENNGEDENNRRRLEQAVQDEGNLFNLLAYSSACSIFEYPLACPDPFGAKAAFDWNPFKSSRPKPNWIEWLGLALFIMGLIILLVTCCISSSNHGEDEHHNDRHSKSHRERKSRSPKRRSFKNWFRKKILRRRS